MREMESLGSGTTIEEAIEDAKTAAENEFLEVINEYQTEILQLPKRGLFSSQKAIVRITFKLETLPPEETKEVDNVSSNNSTEPDEIVQTAEDDYKNHLISFDNLEDVMYTPLAENKELKEQAWALLGDIQQMQIQLQENLRYESETGLFGGEKERNYYDNNNKLVMKITFSVGAFENIYIYTNEGNISIDTKFPIGVNGTSIKNAEIITVRDNRKKSIFSEVSEERTEKGSRIGVHTFRIVFRGEETTVRYNTFGVLIPDFCGISSVLGFRENLKAQKWANELNSQFY